MFSQKTARRRSGDRWLAHEALSSRISSPFASTESASVSRAIHSSNARRSASPSEGRRMRSVSSRPASLRIVFTVWMSS